MMRNNKNLILICLMFCSQMSYSMWNISWGVNDPNSGKDSWRWGTKTRREQNVDIIFAGIPVAYETYVTIEYDGVVDGRVDPIGRRVAVHPVLKEMVFGIFLAASTALTAYFSQQ